MQGWARFSLMVWVAFASLATGLSAQKAVDSEPFDVVILRGHIVDGTGSPWYSGDARAYTARLASHGEMYASE